MSYRAVIFDIGGVVVGSPLHAIAAYERDLGIPAGFVNRVVFDTMPHGAWSRLERGELTLEEFYPAFEADCTAGGQTLSAREMMRRMTEATVPRQGMLDAVATIRRNGLRTAALTNNWIAEDGGTSLLRPHFDVFVESSVVGLRKPDPRIYELACEQLAVVPVDAIFLDDIGMNLKAARALGMTTIKVDSPEQALDELQATLGFDLV
ncbi:MAG: HAD family phosphatase [Deltaproteobacteria bacterium]|nr:HAD family phosphatase [Deltaproteobacteria bacterium]